MSNLRPHDTVISRLTALSKISNQQGEALPWTLEGDTVTCQNIALAGIQAPNVLWLKCPVDQKVLLIEIAPEIYFETSEQFGKKVILIRLSAIKDEELALRISNAAKFCVDSLS